MNTNAHRYECALQTFYRWEPDTAVHPLCDTAPLHQAAPPPVAVGTQQHGAATACLLWAAASKLPWRRVSSPVTPC